jgi:hypothetical protein
MLFKVDATWGMRFVEAPTPEVALCKYRLAATREWVAQMGRELSAAVRNSFEPTHIERVSDDPVIR